MPETRFRSSRQEYAFSTNRNSSRSLSSGAGEATGTPFRWRSTTMAGAPGAIGVASGRGCIRTPRIRHVSNVGKSTKLAVGFENKPSSVGSKCDSGRGGGGSVLPSWYPRIPLQDITDIMMEIEKRRANIGEDESLQHESHMLNSSESRTKYCPPTNIGKVPKILLTKNQNNSNSSSACLAPQKKLLENIDTIEKAVMEELSKLKRAPPCKKVEREKRVRSLMSMR